MKEKILLPFRVVDWAMVQAYRALGLLIVQPLRLLLMILGVVSGRLAFALGSLLFAIPLLFGVAVGYSWGFVAGVMFVLFCLKQSRSLQDGLRSLLAKLARHFIGIVPPHFNESIEAEGLHIPESSELQQPPSIKDFAHYGIASQVENERGYDIFKRLSPELQAFIKRV